MLVLVYRHSPETSRSASRLSGQAGRREVPLGAPLDAKAATEMA